MVIVNSLSGGKTSSYMAAHYPADYNVFALVRIDADYCKPKDMSIVKYAVYMLHNQCYTLLTPFSQSSGMFQSFCCLYFVQLC